MRFLLFFFFLIFIGFSYAQPHKTWNYKKFDDKVFHFGAMMGGNSCDFTSYPILDAYELYGLKSLTTKVQPGGQVGIISTMKLFTPVLRLRFIPSISFQEKVLLYTFDNPDTSQTFDLIEEERVSSTSLDFPLMLQYRTLRYNNFAAYFLAGAQYSIDLQSQETATQNFIDPFVKIKKMDFQGQFGVGVEFFLPYFKFGIEIKYSHGLRNTFIQDFTPVSNPINKLYNRIWFLSFTFEG
tara:strand:- start:1659 stop:2375 length:717 start_codon:yes stop_codon:yes gene_type:complete